MVIQNKYRVLICFFVIILSLAVVLKFRETTPSYIKECLSAEQRVKRLDKLENENVTEVYVITDKDSEPVQMLQIVETAGYNDIIKLRVQLDIEEQKLLDLSILSHQESATYGAYAAEEWFRERFVQKKVDTDLRLVKISAHSAEEIVAVTGATITSQAIVDGVNKAFSVFRNFKEGIR